MSSLICSPAGARHDLHDNALGLTPLHWTASHGGIEIMRRLIDAGADPAAEDRTAGWPWIWRTGTARANTSTV